MIDDDERLALTKRFRDEGLDIYLTDEKKLPHVWRWLVDAETNCLSLRMQIEKLHRQQEQDLKEVEEYIEHVWKTSNERFSQLEKEKKNLWEELENYKRSEHLKMKEHYQQHLNNDSNSSNSTAYNLSDSLKLKSGFKQLFQNSKGDKKTKQQKQPGVDMPIDKITSNFENRLQILQKQCHEYQDQLEKCQEKSKKLESMNRNMEIQIETLSFKLGEALSNGDDLEKRLREWKRRKSTTTSDMKDAGDASTCPFKKRSDKMVKDDDKDGYQKSNETDEEIEKLGNEPRVSRKKSQPCSYKLSEESATEPSSSSSSLPRRKESQVTLVTQFDELKHRTERLEQELMSKKEALSGLAIKYENRKQKHRERMMRLRDHIERENMRWHQIFEAANSRKINAEQELDQQKKLCAILQKQTSMNIEDLK